MISFLRFIAKPRLSLLDALAFLIAYTLPFWWGIVVIVIGAAASAALECRLRDEVRP